LKFTADFPDEFQLPKSIRSRVTFNNKDGEIIYVILSYGFENELHGELSKRFKGEIKWSSTLDSSYIDEKKGCHVIYAKFPTLDEVPQNLIIGTRLVLNVSFTSMDREKTPANGSVFTFTGTLAKEKEDDIFDPVWVIYGFGKQSGKNTIGVSYQSGSKRQLFES
jgi:hypothetical protein